jgi:hypothetical protein
MVSQVLIDKVAESQFDDLPEWQVADILNAPDASFDTSAPESLRGACIVVRDTFKETNTIRTSLSGIYTQTNTVLTGLLGAGVITQGTYDALIALTNRRPSWAEHNNILVTAREVGLARGAS